ncbi:syntaxin-1B-like [Vanessa atalanta]|uniref:syntaxin-1B-like n=1 Tax=Vanessa atalanta TaxID=42275 RepID=UPI001FCCEAE5|nr:syntaxin-1B-like [Vanessa atalanta]
MRSKDRLEELRHLASNAGVYNETVMEVPPEESNVDVDDLFKEVESIRGWIHEMNHNTQLIRRLHSDPTYHTNKHLQDQLDSVVSQSNAIGLKVCGALRQLEARARAAASARGAAARITRLQYAATRRLYAEALDRHQLALQLLRDYQHRLLQDQIKLTNLTISDEECEHLLESNNISLFVDNLRAETAEARLALREAEVRRDELVRVEASLQSVRDLFVQLAHLVAVQQEQIDSVEYYALQATEHVESGGQQLLKGTVSRRKAKKKKMGLIICLASGFLIVLLVLVCT